MSTLGVAPCDQTVARTAPARTPGRGSEAGWILAATILGSSLAFTDGSVVTVALPVIQSDLKATIVGAQWVVEAYLVFLSALILAGGAVGDRWGRERVYVVGVALFGVASAACGLAPTIGWLIAARAVQGIGAALLIPESLAMLGGAFTPGERGRAVGTWAAATSAVSAIGPVVGGWLAQHASWRWIFFLNLPIVVAVLLIMWQKVPLRRPTSGAGGMLDVTGAVVITLGLAALTMGLIEAPTVGMVSFGGLGLIVLGVLLLAVFVFLEDRVTRPLVPLWLFRSRAFSGANLITFLLYAAVGGALFFLPFELIQVNHYTPTVAGAALLPMVILMALFSRAAGALAEQIGQRWPLAVGSAFAAFGLALLASASPSANYWHAVFPGAIVLGLGVTMAVAPLTTAVLSSVDDEYEGVASGVNNAVARVATLLAVAVLGLVVVHAFTFRLGTALTDAGVTPAVRDAVTRQALRLASIVPPAGTDTTMRAAVDRAVATSYAGAFRLAMLVSAAFAAAGAVVALVVLPARPRRTLGTLKPRRSDSRRR